MDNICFLDFSRCQTDLMVYISDLLKVYINRILILNKTLMIYFPSLSLKDPFVVGTANYAQSRIDIMGTQNIDILEARLAHELTHISLRNEGFAEFNSPNRVSDQLSNLLDHIIIQERIRIHGFNLSEILTLPTIAKRALMDDFLVINKEKGPGDKAGCKYSVLTIVDDLIAFGEFIPDDYSKLMKDNLPQCFHCATLLLGKLKSKYNNLIDISPEQYLAIKNEIEMALDIGPY